MRKGPELEISPVPRPRPLSAVGRLVVVAAFLAPLTLLTLLPVMLGLDRYVVTSDAMGGSMGRGALVYAHAVPVGDLAVGDVITFTPPHSEPGARVTRRVVALDATEARTQGDARPVPDPWTVPLDQPVQSKVVLSVPWVGYPFTGPVARTTWTLAGLGAGAVLAVGARRSALARRRPGPLSPPGVSRVIT
ncbi:MULTISPECIES: hypothetical protein [unclassified Nocardioides]|uniref:hypothetical protein n=1 Tax=unclassified Nocardioides TaxID=2615069 RepID=UPI003015354C